MNQAALSLAYDGLAEDITRDGTGRYGDERFEYADGEPFLLAQWTFRTTWPSARSWMSIESEFYGTEWAARFRAVYENKRVAILGARQKGMRSGQVIPSFVGADIPILRHDSEIEFLSMYFTLWANTPQPVWTGEGAPPFLRERVFLAHPWRPYWPGRDGWGKWLGDERRWRQKHRLLIPSRLCGGI